MAKKTTRKLKRGVPSPASPGSAKLTVRVTMRITEDHVIEREVEAAEFRKQRESGDVAHWLEGQFIHDPMPDSDINTLSVELEEWEVISPNVQDHPLAPARPAFNTERSNKKNAENTKDK